MKHLSELKPKACKIFNKSSFANMSMNVLDAISSYLDRVIGDPKLSGMKALLLDEETSRISSLIYSQTEVMGPSLVIFRFWQSNGENGIEFDRSCIFDFLKGYGKRSILSGIPWSFQEPRAYASPKSFHPLSPYNRKC